MVVVMDRVGGYLGYLALCENAHDYDLVMVALYGESDARRIAALKVRAGGHG